MTSHNVTKSCDLVKYAYFKVSMSKCGPVIKEIAKNPPSSADTGKNTPKGGKGKKDAKEVRKIPY